MSFSYMYPRLLLTSHFWTLQQRNEFAIIFLRNRLEYNRSVLRLLQAKKKQIKNDDLYANWQQVLGQLGSGLHPTANEIVAIKDLFRRPPYSTNSLGSIHIVSINIAIFCIFYLNRNQLMLLSFQTEIFVRFAWHPPRTLQAISSNISHIVHTSHGLCNYKRRWRT